MHKCKICGTRFSGFVEMWVCYKQGNPPVKFRVGTEAEWLQDKRRGSMKTRPVRIVRTEVRRTSSKRHLRYYLVRTLDDKPERNIWTTGDRLQPQK